MFSVSEAVARRRCVRAFLGRPVERRLVEELLAGAARAPSGGNLQPWHVDTVAGEALEELKALARARLAAEPNGEGTELRVYPERLEEPWRGRRFAVGEGLYNALGIARDDKPARQRQFARNFELFGAPVGLFFSLDRAFDRPQWAHLGMFMQNLMLLAEERGLGTCPQEAWAILPRTLSSFLGIPERRIFYCGMALGWPDPAHPANRLATAREPVSGFATFRGFGS